MPQLPEPALETALGGVDEARAALVDEGILLVGVRVLRLITYRSHSLLPYDLDVRQKYTAASGPAKAAMTAMAIAARARTQGRGYVFFFCA